MHSQRGFTLIELSIVLVIIGLIVGGVLVGKDLIEAAKIRQVISEQEKLKTAINTFKLKYNCLPGDCANAAQFFTGVINGNGNGAIYSGNLGGGYNENLLAWLELGLSGLIDGTYQGKHAGDPQNYIFGGNGATNYPSAYRVRTGYQIGLYSGWTKDWVKVNMLTLESQTNIHPWAQANEIMVNHTYAIDMKIDDGKPGTGKVLAWLEVDENGNNLNCYNGGPIASEPQRQNAVYAINTSGKCSMSFLLE